MANSSESLIFPAIEPFNAGLISASPIHEIYFEECGDPAGAPVLVLHGGPGSGCTPGQRRFFDPMHYRIILFDQRGCNRSRPQGCTEDNTTRDLVEDIERLRRHLDIDRWMVFGGSWGSTLALAYAAAYPQRVQGLVLRGIFLARRCELNWFLYECRNFFPEAWENLVAPLAPEERSDILASYARRVFDNDSQSNVSAARHWNAFEASIISLLPAPAPTPAPPSDETILARARIQLHYLTNDCFLRNTPLLEQVEKFRHISAVIIQGRYDMVCPPRTAYELHQAWPEADFQIIADAGHAAFEPGTAAALIAATERFKSLK
jgi:proline iminopeptidase